MREWGQRFPNFESGATGEVAELLRGDHGLAPDVELVVVAQALVAVARGRRRRADRACWPLALRDSGMMVATPRWPCNSPR